MHSRGTVRTSAPGEGGGSEGGRNGDCEMGGGDSGARDRGSEGDMGGTAAVLTSFEILGGDESTAVQRALGSHANAARAPTVRSQPLHRVLRPRLHVTGCERRDESARTAERATRALRTGGGRASGHIARR